MLAIYTEYHQVVAKRRSLIVSLVYGFRCSPGLSGFCCLYIIHVAYTWNPTLRMDQQKIRFSGAGASHQHKAAECAIQTVVTMARTMLIHAALRCPDDTFSTDIWPIAIDYAVWVYNRTPDMQSGLSAIEIWSRSRFEPVSETLSNCHVWGCPTYV